MLDKFPGLPNTFKNIGSLNYQGSINRERVCKEKILPSSRAAIVGPPHIVSNQYLPWLLSSSCFSNLVDSQSYTLKLKVLETQTSPCPTLCTPVPRDRMNFLHSTSISPQKIPDNFLNRVNLHLIEQPHGGKINRIRR